MEGEGEAEWEGEVTSVSTVYFGDCLYSQALTSLHQSSQLVD